MVVFSLEERKELRGAYPNRQDDWKAVGRSEKLPVDLDEDMRKREWKGGSAKESKQSQSLNGKEKVVEEKDGQPVPDLLFRHLRWSLNRVEMIDSKQEVGRANHGGGKGSIEVEYGVGVGGPPRKIESGTVLGQSGLSKGSNTKYETERGRQWKGESSVLVTLQKETVGVKVDGFTGGSSVVGENSGRATPKDRVRNGSWIERVIEGVGHGARKITKQTMERESSVLVTVQKDSIGFDPRRENRLVDGFTEVLRSPVIVSSPKLSNGGLTKVSESNNRKSRENGIVSIAGVLIRGRLLASWTGLKGHGFIYILSVPGSSLKKVGFTKRDPTVRLKEWQASCPSMSFELQSYIECHRVKETEKRIHRMLRRLRVIRRCPDCRQRHRELFVVNASDAFASDALYDLLIECFRAFLRGWYLIIHVVVNVSDGIVILKGTRIEKFGWTKLFFHALSQAASAKSRHVRKSKEYVSGGSSGKKKKTTSHKENSSRHRGNGSTRTAPAISAAVKTRLRMDLEEYRDSRRAYGRDFSSEIHPGTGSTSTADSGSDIRRQMDDMSMTPTEDDEQANEIKYVNEDMEDGDTAVFVMQVEALSNREFF
ncbi:hypothetical protein K435DRAFT_846104 [Dendrothele bispora CBS 962.96]|uniref:Bacteriophage T5 Orf172 DNA-binding domain-containing protein n=1 Tax=Dendrothele bispora (strain CBS 962.96) TaxID=1314807 RepID=A0A4S8KPW5_DENBC|nr:hypothetical protein K435DRAFT_846104 [Dendrothele bispora CBS 962.96]